MFTSVKPFFQVAKIMGSTPYEIINNKLVITKRGIANSFLISSLISYSLLETLEFSITSHWDAKPKYLKFVRITSNYICLLSDILITVYSKDRLASALKNLQSYDLATKFSEKNSESLRVYCRAVLVFVFCFWIVVGYFAVDDRNSVHVSGFFRYTFFYGSISMQILDFTGLMLLLYRRFRHLNQLVQPKKFVDATEKIEGDQDFDIEIQHVWWVHVKLASAAEEINKVYTVQLLLWTFAFSMNMLSRLDTLINENYFDDEFIIIRHVFCTIGYFMHLIFFIVACHFTSREANRISEKIFSPVSIVETKPYSVEDDNDAIAYFCIKKVNFTAAGGFLKIQLSLLISIIGVMTTFLVILHKDPDSVD